MLVGFEMVPKIPDADGVKPLKIEIQSKKVSRKVENFEANYVSRELQNFRKPPKLPTIDARVVSAEPTNLFQRHENEKKKKKKAKYCFPQNTKTLSTYPQAPSL